MKPNFTINEDLSLSYADGFEYFTQNSVKTQFFVATLNGWALGENEAL